MKPLPADSAVNNSAEPAQSAPKATADG
jgi:hypothetical protein